MKRHPVVQPNDPTIRLIPLTRGQNAIVDTIDFEWLSQWNWSSKKRKDTFYARRHETVDGKRTVIYMHRVIVGGNPVETDHNNGNGLDNRRLNIKGCTRKQNQSNRRDSRRKEPEIGSAWLLY